MGIVAVPASVNSATSANREGNDRVWEAGAYRYPLSLRVGAAREKVDRCEEAEAAEPPRENFA